MKHFNADLDAHKKCSSLGDLGDLDSSIWLSNRSQD
jgi:hypothetical protein